MIESKLNSVLLWLTLISIVSPKCPTNLSNDLDNITKLSNYSSVSLLVVFDRKKKFEEVSNYINSKLVRWISPYLYDYGPNIISGILLLSANQTDYSETFMIDDDSYGIMRLPLLYDTINHYENCTVYEYNDQDMLWYSSKTGQIIEAPNDTEFISLCFETISNFAVACDLKNSKHTFLSLTFALLYTIILLNL